MVQRYRRLELGDHRPWVLVEGELGRVLDRAPWEGGLPTPRVVPLTGARALCPVAPSKILGIGRNYRAHAAELGHDVPQEPLLFLKAPSSLAGPDAVVALPPESERVDWEGELGVVVGRRVRRIGEAEAGSAVLGYVVLCDVTARDLQKKDGQWSRAKGFDGFCPVGAELVTGVDPGSLRVQTRVNGALKQDAPTSDMIFSVARLVSHLSQAMTLEPGDLIATGTPEGVGALAAGDDVEVTVEGVGAVRFRVVREGAAG